MLYTTLGNGSRAKLVTNILWNDGTKGKTLLYTTLGNASRAKLVTTILGNDGTKGKK